MKAEAYRKSRHAYTYEDELVCPYCDEIIEDAYEYFDEREETREVECPECEKKFTASFDGHKYNSYVLDCKDNKHKWVKQKNTYKSDYSHGWKTGKSENVYYCDNCSEMKFVPLKDDGTEYTVDEIAKEDKKEAKLRKRQENKCDYPFNGNKTASYFLYDTSLHIATEEAFGNRRLFLDIILHLRKLGFEIGKDQDIDKNYHMLNKTHRYGVMKGLEFSADYYNTGMKFEFFQNVTPTSGRKLGDGKYGFDKLKYMSYLMSKRFIFTRNSVIKYLESRGIVEKVKKHLTWHGQPDLDAYKTNREKVAAIKTTTDNVSEYNSKDRDKKEIKNGDKKCFYSPYTKRLNVGYAFHNINNMWWVVLNDEEYHNIAAFELFDFSPDAPLRKPVEIERVIDKLNRKLNSLIEKSDFEKCIKVRDSIKLLKSRITKDAVK